LDFYSASSLKLQFEGRHDAPLGHITLILSQQFEGRHDAPLGHITLILSQQVFALTPDRH